MLLNWVRFRPGISDSGAISSTGCGAVCDRAPTQGCLGFVPIRGSKQWDGHFTNILIESGVQPSYMNGFFGLSGDLRGIFVYNAKIVDGW